MHAYKWVDAETAYVDVLQHMAESDEAGRDLDRDGGDPDAVLRRGNAEAMIAAIVSEAKSRMDPWGFDRWCEECHGEARRRGY